MLRWFTSLGVLLVAGTLLPAQQGLNAEQLARIKKAAVYLIVKDGTRGGSGSGFVVKHDGDDLYIVTNHHVIEPQFERIVRGLERTGNSPVNVQVIFDSGNPQERVAKGTVLAVDPDRDLAVVKVSKVKDPPKPLDITDPPALMETMPVFACGFPFGDRLAEGDKHPEITITPCTVSSIRKDENGTLKTIQIAGNLNPGNSGGAMVSADGKVVGVAVRSILGAGIGEAVPQQDIGKMLKGRPGRVKLTAAKDKPEEGAADLTVAIIDPLKVIKSVKAHYRKSLPLVAPKDGEGPKVMPEAKTVDMTVTDGVATGVVMTADGKAVIQIEMELADGTLFTPPMEIKVTIPRVAGNDPSPNPDMLPGKGNGKPGFRGRDGRVHELPARPTNEKPKASDSAADLSEVNRKADIFLDKSVTLEGLSNCQLVPAENGFYEITVLTEANNPANNLRLLLPRDLALQLSEQYVPDVLDVKFALRLEGKVVKPRGRSAAHPVEVSELHFLDAEAKPVTTLKPDTKASSEKPTLAMVNRFPAEFKGKSLTLEGVIMGVNNSEKGMALNVMHPNGMAVLNLKFYTSKDLSTQVDSDIPREGAFARFDCTVEGVDGRQGHGVVGISSIELLGPDGKPTKKLPGEGKIIYPVIASATPTFVKPAPSTTPNDAAQVGPSTNRRTPAPTEPKASDGSLGLYLGIGGGVGLVALVAAGFMFLRKKKTPQAGKYARKSATLEVNKETPIPAAKPVAKAPAPPKPAAKPASKPTRPPAPGADNPFANFE